MSKGLHGDQPARPETVKRSHGYQSRNPAMSPHTGTSGLLSHYDNSWKRKKRRVVGGKQKNKRSTNAENQRLHNTLPNTVPDSCYTETSWPTWACAHIPETTDRWANHSIMDPDAQENQHLFVFNEAKLHLTTFKYYLVLNNNNNNNNNLLH